MTVQDLQNVENSYLILLKTKLATLQAVGSWNWPAYKVTDVSGVVLAFRQLSATQYEIVYEVTLTSTNVIPQAQNGMQEVAPGGSSSFTFVQIGNSIPIAGRAYATKILSTYIGPAPVAPPSGAAPAGSPVDPPHPPP